jgi:hypothetical protein
VGAGLGVVDLDKDGPVRHGVLAGG